MPKFTGSSVEPLEYNFRDIPKEEGKGYCSGKGVIPEPSQADLDELQDLLDEYPPGKLAKMNREEAREADERTLEAIVKLCKNTPSMEEILELPPRQRKGFVKVLIKELLDPEVSSAGILG